MSEEKKKYICKLPTNGYQAGDEVFLTDAEVANFNGGEETPRFVPADESAADAPSETPAPEVTADQNPASPEGGYQADEPKDDTQTPPSDTVVSDADSQPQQ